MVAERATPGQPARRCRSSRRTWPLARSRSACGIRGPVYHLAWPPAPRRARLRRRRSGCIQRRRGRGGRGRRARRRRMTPLSRQPACANARPVAATTTTRPGACRPFDLARDGFVMSARARACWCWRRWSTPLRRGARIYAELAGGRRHRQTPTTSPTPEPDGVRRAAGDAPGDERRRAGAGRHRLHLRPRHRHAGRRHRRGRPPSSTPSATTPIGSIVSAPKSMIGHMLGAAGRRRRGRRVLAIARRHRAADDQPDRPRPGVRSSTACRTSALPACRCAPRWSTASASAARTAPSPSSPTSERARRRGQGPAHPEPRRRRLG